MPHVSEGQPAPDFSLPDANGNTVSLSDFRGKKNVILYFYPKDDTPGCTKEACAFRDDLSSFDGLDAQVLGVSRDGEDSHLKFAAKYSLPFPLLADTQGTVTELYGVWQEKNMYGKKSMGIVRSTFVIDKQGIIRKVFSRVSVDGHSAQLQEFLSNSL